MTTLPRVLEWKTFSEIEEILPESKKARTDIYRDQRIFEAFAALRLHFLPRSASASAKPDAAYVLAAVTATENLNGIRLSDCLVW